MFDFFADSVGRIDELMPLYRCVESGGLAGKFFVIPEPDVIAHLAGCGIVPTPLEAPDFPTESIGALIQSIDPHHGLGLPDNDRPLVVVMGNNLRMKG